MSSARARAHANIALAKYWGKIDDGLNLPAVPSISLTLKALSTDTTVDFDEALCADALSLDGQPASAAETARVAQLLDRVRAESGITAHARVTSRNDFPTASGLASSASGFAALATAARAAAGLDFDPSAASALARRSSASAARSLFGGWVQLPAGTPGDDSLTAAPLFGADHWPLVIVVAVTSEARKTVGSTEGMKRSREDSPEYARWLQEAPALTEEIRQALAARDLARLGAAAEQSAMQMHACAEAAGLHYIQPATRAAIDALRAQRDSGVSVWATVDAGPQLKALCHAQDAQRVARHLESVDGVLRTIVAEPGPGAELLP